MTALDWQVCLITAAAIAGTVFPVAYTILAPWWRSTVGRSLVVSEVSLAALLDISLAAYWWHFTVPDPVLTSLYTLIAIGAWLRLSALFHEQITKRRR